MDAIKITQIEFDTSHPLTSGILFQVGLYERDECRQFIVGNSILTPPSKKSKVSPEGAGTDGINDKVCITMLLKHGVMIKTNIGRCTYNFGQWP